MTDNVSPEEKKDRFLRFEQVIKSNQINIFQDYVNKTVEVLVEKVSNKNETELSGHTTCQKVVNFKGNSELLGEIVKVKISEAKINTLYGDFCGK